MSKGFYLLMVLNAAGQMAIPNFSGIADQHSWMTFWSGLFLCFLTLLIWIATPISKNVRRAAVAMSPNFTVPEIKARNWFADVLMFAGALCLTYALFTSEHPSAPTDAGLGLVLMVAALWMECTVNLWRTAE